MSRSNYVGDCENVALYRNSVERALQGKRGQAFLREMLASLDAMPEKRLVTGLIDGEELTDEEAEDAGYGYRLVHAEGCCAMGSVALARGVDVAQLDASDRAKVGAALGIAPSMAAEIAFFNDEMPYKAESPEERWVRMRAWVDSQIREVRS